MPQVKKNWRDTMGDRISDLLDMIATLESDLQTALSARAHELKQEFKRDRIEFEAELLRRQKELRQGMLAYLKSANPVSIVTAPIIYSLVVPLALVDLFLWVYQTICFPVYGISKVRRSDYLIFDRAGLAYLNPIEKLNCAYCSYANGIIAYAREIGARTEAHWCPIKHARNYLGTHPYYLKFADYGDADAFRDLTAPKATDPNKDEARL